MGVPDEAAEVVDARQEAEGVQEVVEEARRVVEEGSRKKLADPIARLEKSMKMQTLLFLKAPRKLPTSKRAQKRQGRLMRHSSKMSRLWKERGKE